MAGEGLLPLISAIESDAHNPQHWTAFWSALRDDPQRPEPEPFFRVLAKAMRLEQVEREQAEAIAFAQILLFWNTCGSPARFVKLSAADNHADSAGQALRELIHTYLGWAVLGRLQSENLVVATRTDLLRRAAEGSLPPLPRALDLTSAVAIYAFVREYLFEEAIEERAIVENIAARICASNSPDPLDVAIVAAYRPLRGLPCAEKVRAALGNHTSPMLRRLIQIDIGNGIEEEKLRATIPRLTKIADETSHAVQAQYEESPYPPYNFEHPPQAARENRIPRGRVLIAGCGTHQALMFAATESAEDIRAIDLSLTSLAYAKRLAEKHGFGAIRFGQADILALRELNEVFDHIECTGVLHHLRDPEEGLKSLRDRLAPGGRLGLQVYAMSGRRAVPYAIALREHLNLGASLQDIRKLRKAIIALPKIDPARGVAKHLDFYFSSACRDLIFHVQEHTYDLPKLASLAESADMVIDSLEIPQKSRNFFFERFPDGDLRNLSLWAQLEEEREGLFGPMYRVVLCRRGD